MEYTNQAVIHQKFGRGIISAIEGNVMRVDFSGFGTRVFRFPDAFSTFLSAENDEFKAEILQKLDALREAALVKAAEVQLTQVASIATARNAQKKGARGKSRK